MKLSNFENEEALDLLADIIDPVTEMMQDPGLVNLSRTGKKIEVIKYVLKNHKSNVIEILARLDGKTPEEYKGNIISMTKDLLELLNDEEMKGFFTSQGQTNDGTSSGPVTEITEGKKK